MSLHEFLEETATFIRSQHEQYELENPTLMGHLTEGKDTGFQKPEPDSSLDQETPAEGTALPESTDIETTAEDVAEEKNESEPS